jgi:cellulose synthase operon protein C
VKPRFELKLPVRVLAAAAAFALATAASGADRKPKPTGTIKDLEQREIVVKPEPPGDVQPQRAIEQYRKFLELKSGDPALRAEAMRRLGDLQVEVDEQARGSGEIVDPASGLQLKDAIDLYENLLKSFPDYARNDTVMYQLSRAYEAQAKPERALAVLDQLVQRHPQSSWITEAQFRRGEILFSQGQYRAAESAYAAVAGAGPQTGFYDQGLYKQAWSLFKQSRSDESVASFLKLLDRVMVSDGKLRDAQSLTRPERELSADAFRAVAITFADLEGPETLDDTLRGRGDPVYAHLLYEALGNLYIEKERYQDAAKAYEAFAARRPDDRYAPSLQVRAIEAYDKGGFASLVIAGKQAFVERYAFGSPFWSQRTVQDAPEVAAQLKANLKDLAEYHHARAQKSKQSDDYIAAARWYRAMLESFPQDAEAPATRYLLAEVLFDNKRYAEAAQEYERTAYEYPAHPKAESAGYAALVAYDKHEPSLSGAAREAWHRKGIESQLMFATSFPEHAEAGVVQTKAAEELFKLNEFDRTIEVTRQVLDRQPPVASRHQRTATTLLAHSLFDRGRYAESETAYLKVQGLLPADDPERPAVVERIAASIYKQGEAKQTAGDTQAAVNDYLRVGVLAPTAKARATAEYDAASLLVNAGQWQQAATVLEAFRSNHPNHELAPEVTRKLAVVYLESGRNGESAAEFERMAAVKSESAEVRRTALWQSAELYEKAGQQSSAARVYANYIEQFPAPLDPAVNARQKLADMAEAQNDVRTRTKWLDEIVRADKSAGSARTDRSRYLAARATLESTLPAVASFEAIKLVVPLERSLKQKRAAMEKVLTAYGRALDYQVAEVTTAATYGMAELYRQLGADLMSSERPKELNGEEREQYDVLLEEQAFPFEEKAIELHQVNTQRTRDGIYDPWIQRSFDVLAKLNPARYAKAEIGEDHVSTLR